MDRIRFLYPDEQYPHDEETVRAMMLLGGTEAQIIESVCVAAINMRVDRESKTRYANGVLRNLMNPRPEPVYGFDGEDEPDVDDMSDYEAPPRGIFRRWPR
jgi:hypothetical protein